MSGNQRVTSFGDSTAQPPTPKQTPTSTASFFPSPIFETPKVGFSEISNTTTTTPGPDWTPRFAEDFSVFNNTPGNLRGSHGPFADFVAPFTSPLIHDSAQLEPIIFSPTTSKQHKRPLSVGNIATEITAHANHPPSDSSRPLPPAEPSRRLSSSSGSLVFAAFSPTIGEEKDDREHSPDYYGSRPTPGSPVASRVPKKARGAPTHVKDRKTSTKSQTATPPPSARKVGRKIAPKLTTSAMQSDQGFGPQHHAPHEFLNTPQQQHMATFATSPNNLYAYPMSAPATASAFADARSFWGDGDHNMVAMDVDYTAAGGHIFGTPTSVQRQLDSIDWTQANQAYMIESAQHQLDGHHLQEMHMTAGSNPKQMMPSNLDTTSVSHQTVYTGSYPTPVDDPFCIGSPNGGVNPGLLFSRPPSSSMDIMASAPPNAPTTLTMADSAFDQQRLLPGSSAPTALQMSQSSPPQAILAKTPAAVRKELRRSASAKEIAPRRKAGERASASSPVKSAARPNLSRSYSESRGPRLRGRASLPTLAPAAAKVSSSSTSQGAAFPNAGTGLGITRSASFGGSRPTGRSSPIRMHHQRQQQQQQQQQLHDPHLRLSSLTSIPEVNTPQSRASVKFTIDANGRARVEAAEDEKGALPPSTLRRNQSARSLHRKSKWDSSTDDDSSSTDDEEIVIPSRTTSFALPDPIKPTVGRVPLHSSQRSLSDHSTTSTAMTVPGEVTFDDPESEAETVMNDVPNSGDAASELEKLRQMRQKRANMTGSGNGVTGPNNLFGSVQCGLQFGGLLGGDIGYQGNNRSHAMPDAVSPTTLTDASLPTPSTGSRSHGIRCICGRPDAPPSSDGFIVQCESCDLWLHGRCINITKRTLPAMYICAFCAQTPNVRGMRLPPVGAASSPLAHKSFKTFR